MSTASMGNKNSQTNHMACRRCGKIAYHKTKGVCSSCGYGKSSKIRKYAWQKPSKR